MKYQAKIIKSVIYNFRLITVALAFSFLFSSAAQAYFNPSLVIPPGNSPQTSSTGVVGTIPSPAPTTAATIATPASGQSFTTEPVTVSGLCSGTLLIELFDNGVFSGSAQCNNGTYTITTYLFTGSNSLVAKDFDALNQEGPDSNIVSVSYASPGGTVLGITLTSNYARLGADPGSLLTWPIIMDNGTVPYAIDVSWGDGSTDSLISRGAGGVFDISHSYKVAGVYTILIRATDASNNTAYLQLVAVANGKINQATITTNNSNTKIKFSITNEMIWILAAVAIILSPIAFWLGLRHQLRVVKQKLEQGERPFK